MQRPRTRGATEGVRREGPPGNSCSRPPLYSVSAASPYASALLLACGLPVEKRCCLDHLSAQKSKRKLLGNKRCTEDTTDWHRVRQGLSRYRITFPLALVLCLFQVSSGQVCSSLGKISMAEKYSPNSLQEMMTLCQDLCSFSSFR